MRNFIIFIGYIVGLLTLLLSVSCGIQNKTDSMVKDSTVAQAVPPSPYAVLFYWDNQNFGFGHVSVQIYADKNQTKPTYYLSYAMGNDPAYDMRKHQKIPQIVILPNITPADFARFQTWYEASEYFNVDSPNYGSGYAIFSHNCAHAALNVLRELSYKVGSSHWGLIPSSVFKQALKIKAQTPEHLSKSTSEIDAETQSASETDAAFANVTAN